MPKAGVGIVNLATGQVTPVAEHVKSFRVPDDVTPQVVVYLAAAEPPPAPAARRGRCGANARQESLRDRSRDPRSVHRHRRPRSRRSATTSSTRRRVAGLRRVVEDAGERRRVRARDRQRRAQDAADRPGQLQGLRVRQRRRAGGVRQRSRRRKSAAPRTSSTTWTTTADAATELPLPANAPMPVSDNGRLEFSKDGSAPVLRHRAAARAPSPTNRRSDQGRHLELQGRRAAADAEGPRRPGAEADLSRRCSISPTSGSCSWRRRDMPDVRIKRQRDAGARRQQRPVPPARVVGRQLRRLLPREARRRHRARRSSTRSTSARRSRPAAATSSTSTKTTTTGTPCASSDGQKTNLTKGLGVKFQSETDDRPEHPTPYGQAGWTDGDNVGAALRPLRHLGSASRRQRRRAC